jgi:hypothetical protein
MNEIFDLIRYDCKGLFQYPVTLVKVILKLF